MSKRSLAKSRDKAPVTKEEPEKPKANGTSTTPPTNETNAKPEQHAHHSHHHRHPVKHHNYAVHRVEAHSPLSSESPEQNYRGFFNLAGIILVVNNLRLVIENLLKYGLLINMNVINHYIDWIDLSWTLTLPVFIGLSLFFEQLVYQKRITEKQYNYLCMLNISSLLIIPASIIRSTNTNPASGIIVLMLTVIVWMKLVSYCVVNKENRRLHLLGNTYHEEIDGVDPKELVTYPNNLTIKNLSYFIAAPTLCYQMNYPRSKAIRWYWLTGKFLQFIFFTSLMVFMTEQYITPTIRNSVHMVNASRNLVWMLSERLLKLSIPMLFVWLLGFYSLFHLWLNILAELLKFSDRSFYKDWWNSTTLDGYWRNWNLPVHHWLLRHLYYPCMRAGINKYLAGALIFFVSAVFHEIIVSIALHTFKLWFFLGMFLQVPMIWFGRLFPQNSQMGNINFWFSFCIVGQPALVLLYYYDYYQRAYHEN